MSNLSRVTIVPALALAIVLNPAQVRADLCLKSQTKRYSEWVGLAAGASNLVPGPVAEAVRKGAVGGTAVGELVDFGLAWWWDPHMEVFPLDPSHVVGPISDAQIISMSNSVLSDLSLGSPYTVTYNDLLNLNTVTPGMGDAATHLLVSGIRTFAYTVEGAAAYGHDGYAGSPDILSAANLLNGALVDYHNAIDAYVPYLQSYDGVAGFPTATAAGLANFISNVQTNGASALPPGEVNAGNDIMALANATMVGTTLADSLTSYISQGDTTNEAALFPAGGFTTSKLLASGSENFKTDCLACTTIAATPEPSVYAFLGAGALCVGGLFRRRYSRRRPPAQR